MKYYTIKPPGSIAAYIRSFWVLEHEEAYIYRSLADGCTEMVFHYNNPFDEIMPGGQIEKSFASGIHAQSRKVRRFTVNRGFGIFGVYMYPFAMKELFAIPANCLSNEMPDLLTILGQEGRDLEERIMLAANNLERVNIMIPFFERRIRATENSSRRVMHIVGKVINSQGTVDIDTLAGDCFLSRRQFERNFKEYAGFSPKLYSRIIRFQAAIREYYAKPKSLTEIAYTCGYYDQSHFIHEFKEFSGFHPKEYFFGVPEGSEYRDVQESLPL
ncbi:MAG TPA: AraC family transcriptional regulator [Chitinophagaceae bacterium]|nr:AraC family transcriptional regulator [Chitinophagaceae bacterium]